MARINIREAARQHTAGDINILDWYSIDTVVTELVRLEKENARLHEQLEELGASFTRVCDKVDEVYEELKKVAT